MPVVPMQQILRNAFDGRYGVGAFNIVDGITMDAVLTAAEETRSPVIVQGVGEDRQGDGRPPDPPDV